MKLLVKNIILRFGLVLASSVFLLVFILPQSALAQTIDTYVITGTWTAPLDVTSVTVECWGGGGAGGGNTTSSDGAGGAGGGAYSKSTTIAVTPGNTYTVTVGLGGVAVSGGTGGTGGAGSTGGLGAAGNDGGDGAAGNDGNNGEDGLIIQFAATS